LASVLGLALGPACDPGPGDDDSAGDDANDDGDDDVGDDDDDDVGDDDDDDDVGDDDDDDDVGDDDDDVGDDDDDDDDDVGDDDDDDDDDDVGDDDDDDDEPATCEALIADFEAETQAIRSCEEDAECGQVLAGTSCGCTRDWVARTDADTTAWQEALDAATSNRCEVSLASPCDCPAAEGYACVDNICTWNYI